MSEPTDAVGCALNGVRSPTSLITFSKKVGEEYEGALESTAN